jgi:hypothetical protein
MTDSPLDTAGKVTKALGGAAVVAQLTGVGRKAVSNWVTSRNFPAKTYVVMNAALRERGLNAPARLWQMFGKGVAMSISDRPYMTHTFEPSRDGEVTIRVTVERAGEPVILSFGDSEFSIPPGLAIALGNVLVTAGKCSFKGQRRQIRLAEEQKIAQDAAGADEDGAAFRRQRLAAAAHGDGE